MAGGLNMHAVVRGLIPNVNPDEQITLKSSTGYTIDPATYQQVPAYTTATVGAQIQALTFEDLKQIESLNIQGIRRRAYFFGDVEGLVRAMMKGGDLIQRADGTWWKVAFVLETWPNWCAVVLVMQNGS